MSVETGAVAANQDLPSIPEAVVVETRFGVYTFTLEHRVHMPKGPLGFQDYHDFGLANLPNPQLAQFKLLQSLDAHDLSFIVTTLPDSGGPIDQADLEEMAAAAGVAVEDAVFLLIVTIRPNPEGEGILMSVNLRAPIVFNPASRLARQCVASNPSYPVQQPFFGWPQGPQLEPQTESGPKAPKAQA